ncbi:MAG: cytochrome c [Acidobacteriaceae bacterium]|nr:cytochrome c [Acidobacteriaceae bacterium]
MPLRLKAGLFLFATVVTRSFGHDIITTKLTFSREIARIFAAHCLACHATGSEIPLSTYAEARPWAVSIKEQVLSRKMPPWGAVKGFGDLWPDHALSEEDILIIAAWVVGGAPEGDPKLLPKYASTLKVMQRPMQREAVVIDTQLELKKPLQIIGIRPLPDGIVETARLTARLPSGDIFPLVWLYQYDPKTQQVFTFRDRLPLPAGTVVQSSKPLRFALLD